MGSDAYPDDRWDGGYILTGLPGQTYDEIHGDGGACTGDRTCVNGCCVSGGRAIGEACSGTSECSTGFCSSIHFGCNNTCYFT